MTSITHTNEQENKMSFMQILSSQVLSHWYGDKLAFGVQEGGRL